LQLLDVPFEVDVDETCLTKMHLEGVEEARPCLKASQSILFDMGIFQGK
jgi:hypothetical protein